jgi:hypothetical protein
VVIILVAPAIVRAGDGSDGPGATGAHRPAGADCPAIRRAED